MATHIINYPAKRYTTGLTDVVYSVFNQAGTSAATGTLTEAGSTGVYLGAYSSTTAGSYFWIADSATQPSMQSEKFLIDETAGTVDALSTSTSYLHVKWRLGDIEANLGTGSANIVSQAISGAQAEVDQLTDSATGTVVTFAVADLAAGFVVDTMLGRDDLPVSNQRMQMAKHLKENAYKKLISKGHDLRYKLVNI